MIFTYCNSVALISATSPGTPVSYINKTDRYDTTEILLKMALNTITFTKKPRVGIREYTCNMTRKVQDFF